MCAQRVNVCIKGLHRETARASYMHVCSNVVEYIFYYNDDDHQYNKIFYHYCQLESKVLHTNTKL
jgi:hypothetical protein